MEADGIGKAQGFAFRYGASDLFDKLCENESNGEGVRGVVLEYLGPNGERPAFGVQEFEPAVSSVFSVPVGCIDSCHWCGAMLVHVKTGCSGGQPAYT